MSNDDIYNEFKPTYLYIKQHSITGKLYFGKTYNKLGPIKYLGSGTKWVNHITKHGKEYVVTLWYELFENKDELINFAISFSNEMDIVDSESWLNQIPEDGLDIHGVTSEFAKENVKNQVENGTLNFIGGDIQRKTQRRLIEAGTHHWLGPESNAKRVKDGTHNFLNGECGKRGIAKQKELGIHALSGGKLQNSKFDREIYQEIRQLYKNANAPIPKNLYMRSDEFLEKIKKELINENCI